MKKAFLLLLTTLLLTGCVPPIYIHTQVDPTYDFLKLNKPKVCVFPFSELNIEQKKFRRLLIPELLKLNFEVIEVKQPSDYKLVEFVMLFWISEETSKIDSHLILPDWKRTTGMVGNTTFSASTYGTKSVPYSYSTTTQGIGLAFYQLIDDKFDMIWDGFIGVEQKKYEKNAELCIGKLFNFFGKDFRGNVYIGPSPEQEVFNTRAIPPASRKQK